MTQGRETGSSSQSANREPIIASPRATSAGFVQTLLRALLARRLVVLVLLVFSVTCIGIGIRYLPDLHWIAEREESLRAQIESTPVASYVVGLLLYFGVSLIPGTYGKSIVFGWLFGFLGALFLVEIGLTAAALVSFLIGRFLVKHLLLRRWLIYLRWVNKRFAQDGAFYLLSLRMAHAPFTLINYGAGATSIPFSTFWWTTHVGILPATAVFTFAGSRIPSIRTVAEHGAWAIVDPMLIVALVAIAFLPMLVRPWLRKRLNAN